MEVDRLYKTRRGNQDATVALIVKGSTASVQLFVSAGLPEALTDMVDGTDNQTLTEGTWPFYIFPQYIYFTGTADDIEIVGMGFEDTGVTF